MQDSHSFVHVLQQYFSGSALLPVFVIAVIWIVWKWKIEYKKKVIAVLCGMILVFNEMVYRGFSIVGESITYYRLLWTIPITFIIAVFAVENITKLKKKIQIAVISICILAVLLFSNQTGNEWFQIPKNIYQISTDAIQVADTVMQLTNGEMTYLLDNGGLDMSIRQYEPRIAYTNNSESGLGLILEGERQHVLGSEVMEATFEDRSRYLALRKDEPLIHKLAESAGHTFVAETDHYKIYEVEYYGLYADWQKGIGLSGGRVERTGIEYISVPGVRDKYGYVYISDFGAAENEDVYQEMFEKINALQPQGILINSRQSLASEWYVNYMNELEALQIPYYCNNQEIQVIEQNEFFICMVDNTLGVSEEVLQQLQRLEETEKPVILVLAVPVADETDTFYPLLMKEDFIVQVLSVQKAEYTKVMLGTEVLQFSIPSDENQILSMLYLTDLKNQR